MITYYIVVQGLSRTVKSPIFDLKIKGEIFVLQLIKYDINYLHFSAVKYATFEQNKVSFDSTTLEKYELLFDFHVIRYCVGLDFVEIIRFGKKRYTFK